MYFDHIQQVRLIHRVGNFTAWRDRLIYGCCSTRHIKSNRQLQDLTGIDAGRTIPNHLAALRAANLLDNYQTPKARKVLGYFWVGVMSDDCPLTAEQNVIYWQWWHLPESCPDVKKIARLLDIEPQTVRDCRAALVEHGAADTDVPPIYLKHPRDLLHWWKPKEQAELF